ncbi:hepcidin isoform X1 [Marmota marmota marmota]|uniref:Hepcidin antimicrobial peptide n=1 Tax=Marmota marmota marmota TaxID=9994 RepID=A0A8C5YYT5_MARMA|nr:hepcidin isoform X1 [Marmota marmota marmota]
MALNTQIRAACLLFLLLSSLATTSSLQQQTGQLTRQPAERHPQYTAVTEAHLTPVSQRLRRRDTHFPICIFCCNCCTNSGCGICCRT